MFQVLVGDLECFNVLYAVERAVAVLASPGIEQVFQLLLGIGAYVWEVVCPLSEFA